MRVYVFSSLLDLSLFPCGTSMARRKTGSTELWKALGDLFWFFLLVAALVRMFVMHFLLPGR